MEPSLSVFLRWAVAVTAGASVIAFTTNAVSQDGSAVVLRPAALQLAFASPPNVDIDPAPADQEPAPTLETLVEAQAQDIGSIDADTECLAKVVQHEAGNQPLKGQLAVAEVVLNRMHSSRFPRTACAVVNQPGQFFRIESYHVRRSSARWRTAVAVARVAEAGEAPAAAPGALFFHAAYVRPGWSHRRTLVARIAGQVFYR